MRRKIAAIETVTHSGHDTPAAFSFPCDWYIFCYGDVHDVNIIFFPNPGDITGQHSNGAPRGCLCVAPPSPAFRYRFSVTSPVCNGLWSERININLWFIEYYKDSAPSNLTNQDRDFNSTLNESRKKAACVEIRLNQAFYRELGSYRVLQQT